MANDASATRTDRSASKAEPWVALPLSVRDDAALSPVAFRVLWTIASLDWTVNDRGCTASQQTIADLSHVSLKTVKRSIDALESLGYILKPEPHYANGAIAYTTIRLSGKVRKGRPLFVAQGASDGSQTTLPADDSSVVESPRPHQFASRIYPHVDRVPLIDADKVYLRELDAWGCADSEDVLGVCLGLIAQREARLGRDAASQRLRIIFDGAFRRRELRKAGLSNRVGYLLTGIERGYLLQRSRYERASVTEMPPGAREHLETYIQRAAHGGTISDQTLSDLGIDHATLDALAREQPSAEREQVSNEANSPAGDAEEEAPIAPCARDEVIGDLWSRVLFILKRRVSAPMMNMVYRRATALRADAGSLVLGARDRYHQQQLQAHRALIEEIVSEVLSNPIQVSIEYAESSQQA